MADESSLVLQRQRQLKWKQLDWLEAVLMALCGFTLAAFSFAVVCDIVTREIGRPWLWLQEVTSTFFIYGIFIAAAFIIMWPTSCQTTRRQSTILIWHRSTLSR